MAFFFALHCYLYLLIRIFTMYSITKENTIRIGHFRKPHGVSGNLLLHMEEGHEEMLEDVTILFVETDGLLVPWFVAEEGIRTISSHTALIDLDWIEDEPAAKKLCGKDVWMIPPKGIENGVQPEIFDLKGFEAFDQQKGKLGVVTEINDYAGNIVLTVQQGGAELLVPFHEALVTGYDENRRIIIFELPDGLTDL